MTGEEKKIDIADKVRAMSAKEIIMAMVEGLRNPYTKIDMTTFGEKIDGICFGCAATNTLCQINGGLIKLPEMGVRSERVSVRFNNSKEPDFISAFEDAINYLRQGQLRGYNNIAADLGVAKIKGAFSKIPYLDNNYTEEELQAYVELANLQN